jgi:hypothetical protein
MALVGGGPCIRAQMHVHYLHKQKKKIENINHNNTTKYL